MTWFRVDDHHYDHDKTIEVERVNPLGNLLWFNLGTETARLSGDGIVRAARIPTVAGRSGLNTPSKLEAVKAVFLEFRLFHTHDNWEGCHCISHPKFGWETKLGALPDMRPGDLLFHDWFEYNLVPKARAADELARQIDARRQRLNRLDGRRAAVRNRDQDCCRYCGVECEFDSNDHSSPNAGQIDHVNPFEFRTPKDNALDNLVVSCRRCNDRKKRRTPEQAGMPLLPEPQPYQRPRLVGDDE